MGSSSDDSDSDSVDSDVESQLTTLSEQTSSPTDGSELSAGMSVDSNKSLTLSETRAQRYPSFPAVDSLPSKTQGCLEVNVNDNPPAVDTICLALLHCFVMLGSTVATATVIVPLLRGGKKEKTELILNFTLTAGFSTLLHSFFGTRLPVVMGSSYAYIIPAISLAMSNKVSHNDPKFLFKDSIRAIQGSVLAAGVFQMLFPLTGAIRVYWRSLNPLTIFPLVTLTGLGILSFGFPKLLLCAEVAVPSLAVVVFLSQAMPHMLRSKARLFRNNECLRWMLKLDGNLFRRYSIVLSAGFLWILSVIISVAHYYEKRSVDAQQHCDARTTWLLGGNLGFPSPWHWGTPTFRLGDCFAAMAAAFVAMIESSGAFIAASRYGGATPMPHNVVVRGIVCQGVSTIGASLFGVTGATVSVENVGLLGLTGVGSRRVIQLSATFMIFISVIGQLGAFLASIPLSVVIAWNFLLNGYVVGVGLNYLQFCNLNSYRSLWIAGFSLCTGVAVPAFFREYLAAHGHGIQSSTAFSNIIQIVLTSQATVSVLTGLLADLFFTGRGESSRRDSGRHWLKRFKDYTGARRTADYYAPPFNLPRVWPLV